MKNLQYSDIGGLDRSVEQIIAPQVDFLRLDNFIPNRKRGGLVKRGGSDEFAVTGDIWGIGGYKKAGSSPRIPAIETVLRHRRNGSTSYLEKYSWASGTWANITLGAEVAFATGDITRFAQVSSFLAICGGKPAKLLDAASGSVSRLGGPAPSAALVATASAGAGALTGTYYYVFTFYDSTTGWESSPSPISSLLTISAKDVDISSLPTACAREGVDKKRIYRTISTGEQPFMRVAEVTLAATTYTDSTLDEALGASAPEAGDHDPPPSSCYVCAAHLNRFWLASGNALYYSHPYVGSLPALEYFSEDRKFVFPGYVTALLPTPSGSLLVFCPPGQGIHEILGKTPEEFSNQVFLPAEGTNYGSSVSSHNEYFTYWGEKQPVLVYGTNIVDGWGEGFGELIDDLRMENFSSNIFIWSQWVPSLEQFVFGVSGTVGGGTSWITSLSAEVSWIDAVTGADVPWSEA